MATNNAVNTTLAGQTGTGSFVGSTSPTLTTPILGTPQSGTLTSCTGLPLTTGVTGVLPSANGGTGVNNGSSTVTLGGSLTTSGAFTSTFTMTGNTSVTFPTSGTLATTAQIPSVTPAALTRVDDTNVTLTLGGTPATALLQATSITAGWSGQLAVSRGGTGLASATAYAVLCGGTTSTGAFQSVASVGTSGQVLTSNGAGALPTFKTTAAGNVVQTVDTTNRSTTSTSYVSSSISVTITPSSNTSKVRISCFGIAGTSLAGGGFLSLTLYRDGVDLTPSGVNGMTEVVLTSSGFVATFAFDYIDSPATTSATTYTLYFKTASGTGYIGRRGVDTTVDAPTFITATEIGV